MTWTVKWDDPYNTGGDAYIAAANGRRIATLWEGPDIESARLLAAAPELLAALQWAVSQIDDDLDPDHIAALESARAAIAKATGGGIA